MTLPESDETGTTLNVGVGIAGPVDDPELVYVVIVGDTILRATAQDLEGIDSQRELDAARELLHEDASETTRRVRTDGGLEDEEHPIALVETLDDPDLSEQDVDDAVESRVRRRYDHRQFQSRDSVHAPSTGSTSNGVRMPGD